MSPLPSWNAPWRPLVSLGLLWLAAGCGANSTSQQLDRAYERTTEPASAPRPGATGSEPLPELDLSGPLERDAVVSLAVARSPALAVMAHRARALVHAGRAEGALPESALGFEVWNLPLARPYSLNEADMYMVELRQRFPAAGSLDARARALAEEAEAVLAEVASEERLVAERAATVFADYEQATAVSGLLQRQVRLLERLRQVVRARFTTGGAGLADAARIDVELAKTERALARAKGDIDRSRATLNALLRRPPGATLGPPAEHPAETIRLSLEELSERADKARGSNLSADARLRAAGARREAAEAEANVPEFMVGLGYWQDPTMRPGMGLTTSMSLPWLWGPSRHRVHQAEEEESELVAARMSVGIDAQTELSEAHADLLALEAELNVIRTRGLPSAQRSLEGLAAAFSTGSASLLEWVDVSRSVLDLELEVITLRADLQRRIAGLERAVGTALPRTPLKEAPSP